MDYSDIYNLTNVPKSVHRLPIDVKFHVLQPGDKDPEIKKRITVFQKRRLKNCYHIDLRENVDEIVVRHKAKEPFLTNRQLNLILNHLRKYRHAYVEMWNDASMGNEDLEERMRKIDMDILS